MNTKNIDIEKVSLNDLKVMYYDAMERSAKETENIKILAKLIAIKKSKGDDKSEIDDEEIIPEKEENTVENDDISK